MRLVFFNHAHPDVAHVSGTRLWMLARALSRRGHRVVHMTATVDGQSSVSPADFEATLARHDWNQPLHVAVQPERRRALRVIRDSGTPALPRKALTAYALLLRGGPFYDWTDALAPYQAPLARAFAPEAAMATFGNSSNLHAARAVSRLARCPMAVDFKDMPSAFLPRAMLGPFRRRYGTCAALTANSDFLARHIRAAWGREIEVVYSGVDTDSIQAPGVPPAQPSFMSLVGSVYSEKRVAEVLAGIAQARKAGMHVSLLYVGGDAALVRRCIDRGGFAAWAAAREYLRREEYWNVLRDASINMYITGTSSGFHHKLVELLAAGRPVIAFGGESAESLGIASGVGAALRDPRTADELVASIATSLRATPDAANLERLRQQFSWDAQAVRLERVLVGARGD